MENREKEIRQRIDDQTQNVQVPDGLTPEQIKAKLEGQKKPGQKRRVYYGLGGLAAACLVLVISGIVLRTSFIHNAGKLDDTVLTKAEEVAEPQTADGYDQIYEYLQFWRQNGAQTKNDSTMVEESSIPDMAAQDSAASPEYAGDTGVPAHSDTNVRQEGVGEADYVKTDGSYLYVLKDNRYVIGIVSADGTGMQSIGEIDLGEEIVIQEFYLHGKTLVVLCQNQTIYSDGMELGYSSNDTMLVAFDISDPQNPEELGQVSQSGQYYSARIVGDFIYVFSQFYPDTGSKRNDFEAYVPAVEGDIIPEDRILLPGVPAGQQYMVITSINMTNPDEVVDSTAVFSNGGQCYVSNNNIYIYESQSRWDWGDNWQEDVNEQTNIRKIEYKDGLLTAKAQNKINGTLDSSFCIDEFEGNLRTVVTVNTLTGTSNAVYILDDTLEVVGRLEGLADDERVYSARMMGDVGYFVTFRETDPLFSVDLSDPANPQIIGQLKIPGFSEYLHFYGEGMLLGIGMDVDEATQSTEGVKLSMFDISDPRNVTEVNKFVLDGVYSADAFGDYRAVLIDVEKNLIAFGAYGNAGESYYVFGYDSVKGFECRLETEVNGSSAYGSRGVYIGEILYIVKGNVIEAYSLKDYSKIDDIIL